MCGIVGLFLKNQELKPSLGRHLTPMLVAMSERGPDSAGFAIYGEAAPERCAKFTFSTARADFDWSAVAGQFGRAFECEVRHTVVANHAVFVLAAEADAVLAWMRENHPEISITSVGRRIEVFKDAGLPASVAERFGLARKIGSHGIGHTRMATESGISARHSHPFWAGSDLCLVHNGSLSNHNRLRTDLAHRGQSFESDNDSEVAAKFLSFRMQQGAGLKEALEDGLNELDGFYTLVVGTAGGFAVVRDALACKPAVMAETDDWVAIASEFRSLADLPRIDDAAVWEPKPGTVYSWQHETLQ